MAKKFEGSLPEWKLRTFSGLTAWQLHDILRLRQEVFAVEQYCVYLDVDGTDPESLHLWHESGDSIIAYARIVPPGVIYEQFASIGRVVVAAQFRKNGLGRKLMQEAIQICFRQFPDHAIMISAQVYLIPFYKSLGFSQSGSHYLLDAIPHVEMVL